MQAETKETIRQAIALFLVSAEGKALSFPLWAYSARQAAKMDIVPYVRLLSPNLRCFPTMEYVCESI